MRLSMRGLGKYYASGSGKNRKAIFELTWPELFASAYEENLNQTSPANVWFAPEQPFSQGPYFYGQSIKRQKTTRALHRMAFARLSPRPSRDSVSGA
jgi:hypothetical protein